MRKHLKFAAAALVLAASPAAAEMELSLYLGTQSVSDSNVSGTLPGGVPVSRNFDWKGRPFSLPIYYGGRATWWTNTDLGFGIEGTHTKALGSSADLAATNTSRFEFSDGHNIITLNLMKRWPGAFFGQRLSPYVGAGAGVAIPHVDIRVNGAANRTFGFEVTGPALRGIAGVKYDINDKWALFTEYQITWSDNEVTVDPDLLQTAGQINTEIVTHALNVGFSYSF